MKSFRLRGATLTKRLRAHRTLLVVMAAVMVFSSLIPVLQPLLEKSLSRLSADEERLLDSPSKALAKQFSFDSKTQTYHFNKSGKDNGVEPTNVKSRLTGSDVSETMYSIDMPKDIEKGFTYHDNNLKISFTMTPEAQEGAGVLSEGRLIYRLAGGAKAVFTPKPNGIKEDILINKAPGQDDLNIRYRLDLPKGLEARMLDNGGLGIYSADPALYGNMSYGSDADRERIESAKEKGVKNYLVFGIPAPVIKETGDMKSSVKAKFLLSDDSKVLTVRTTGLKDAHYPLSLDPSVVVTSTNDFLDGENEENISFSTGGELRRGDLTGGTFGAVNSGPNMATKRALFGSVTHNGYIYAIGDWTTPADRYTYEYAKINNDGTLGAWTSGNLTLTSGGGAFASGIGFSLASYNGYVYLTGGNRGANGSATSNETYYATFNSDGSLGSFTLSNQNFTTSRYWHKSAAYNGYLYITGGRTDSADDLDIFTYSDIQFSKLNADGSLGAWQSTTSFTGSRSSHDIQIYNGWIYILGGVSYDNSPLLLPATATNLTSVQRARVKSDGTIGTFAGEASLPVQHRYGGSVVASGYIYLTSGTNNTTGKVWYAELSASGSVGAWRTANDTFTPPSGSMGSVAHNGYLYLYGGASGAGDVNNFEQAYYVKINEAGELTSYTAGTSVTTARMGASSVAYNGYVYVMGGYTGSAYRNDVQYASISSAGVLGAWAATSSFVTTRAYFGATIVGDRIYISGGTNAPVGVPQGNYVPLSDTQSARISSTGNLLGWDNASTLGAGRYGHKMIAYNNRLYNIGGADLTTYYNSAQYADVNGDGTIGSWTTSAQTFSTGRFGHGAVINGNTIYMAGGWNGTSYLSDVQYTTINEDGTINAWSTAANSLGTARWGLSLIAAKGYLYALGGANDAGGATSLTTSEKAIINADKTVGVWNAASAPLATSRSFFGTAVEQGYLVNITGDSSGTKLATTSVAYINNGGSDSMGVWTATSSVTNARTEHGAAAYKGYVYVTGGNSGGATGINDVRYAPLNTDGSIGAWLAGSVLPEVMYGHDTVAYNGHLYAIGGNQTDVYNAKINADGSLGSWTHVSTLGSVRMNAKAAIYKGKIYITGGSSDLGTGATVNSVIYATVNSNGSLGAWSAASSFQGERAMHSAFAVNGYLYIGGGVDNIVGASPTVRDDLQYAKINSDGTLGTWVKTTNMPGPARGIRYVQAGGYVYAIGGRNTTGVTTDGYVTTINADGTLNAWNKTRSLATARWNHTSTAHDGFLYTIGGQAADLSTSLTTAEYASLSAVARKAVYSKLVNPGALIDLLRVSYTGYLGDADHGIMYSTAEANGVLSARKASNVSTESGTTCVNPPTMRYIYMRAVLDDTYSDAFFPDTQRTEQTNILDTTFTFEFSQRAPADRRLHQGKWFYQGSLRPYDTCGP